MLGSASGTKTSNLESFAHWPTQRFETIALAGPPVTICNGAPFRWFWPVFRAGAGIYLANRLFLGVAPTGQFHERYRRVLGVPFEAEVARVIVLRQPIAASPRQHPKMRLTSPVAIAIRRE